MSRPRLLDAFCGAGGAGMGYSRAGFDVTGVDHLPQPHYPFDFIQADALEYIAEHGREYDAIHASPPCQAYTTANNRWRGRSETTAGHPDLVAATRAALEATGRPWVIENVAGARALLPDALTLHGGMFGLGVHRPRLFASDVFMLTPRSPLAIGSVGVYGKAPDGRRLNNYTTQRAPRSLEEAQQAMGIDWMTWDELREAIPPTYCEWIGTQLMRVVKAAA